MFKIHYRHIKIEKLKHVQIILRKTVRGSDREGEFNWGILYKYMELSQWFPFVQLTYPNLKKLKGDSLIEHKFL
jgi:hypothetical protein